MLKLSFNVLILSLLLSLFGLATKGQAQSKNKYTCVSEQGIPRTVVDTKRGKIELIVWKSNFFGSQWSPERRCQEVTRRFQSFSDAGNLKYVTTGKINGYPVICVGDQQTRGYSCDQNGLLITLQPSDHPPSVMNELFNINNRISGGGVTRSSGRPRSRVINMDQFLQDAPLIESADPETTTSIPSLPRESVIPETSTSTPSLPRESVIPETSTFSPSQTPTTPSQSFSDQNRIVVPEELQ
ncbi:MAG: COP23 domain-containing protein [Microcystaceae cyanobacterium]